MYYNKLMEKCDRMRNKFKGKLVQNNTRMFVEEETKNIVIRLHRTDILEFTPDNKCIISLDGWTSVTTMQRCRQYLPIGWISSKYFSIGRKAYPYDSRKSIIVDLSNEELVKGKNQGIEDSLLNEFGKLMHARFSPRKRVTNKLLLAIEENKAIFREIRGKDKLPIFRILAEIRKRVKADKDFLAKVKEFKQKFHNKATKDYFLKYIDERVYMLDIRSFKTTSEYLLHFDMSQKVSTRATNRILTMFKNRKQLEERFNNEYKDKTIFYQGTGYTLSLRNVDSVFNFKYIDFRKIKSYWTSFSKPIDDFFNMIEKGEIGTLDVYNALTEV